MIKKIAVFIIMGVSGFYAFHAGNASKKLDTTTKKSINILFVGNSYTFYNNMPSIVTKISQSINSEYILNTHQITFGGATLERHWKKQEALNEIKKGKWDYVVFQGQSTSMLWNGGVKSFDTHLKKFSDEIKKTNTKIILFSTWPRQKNNSYYKKSALTYSKALNQIQKQYYKFAQKYNTGIVYTGTPFYKANEMGIETYSNDGSHPNLNGSYIVALSFVKNFFPNISIDCNKITKNITIKKEECAQINKIF